MRIKRTAQITVDALMTVLLLVMFAVPWTGVLRHERLACVLFVLFILHNALNFRWYLSLTHGPYNARRAVWAAINLCLLAAMALTAYSGVMISQHAFAFLQLNGSLLWRKIHLCASYWGLILTGMHIGLHGPALTGALKKRFPAQVLKGLAAGLCAYGLYACWQMRLWQKLFFLETFSVPAPSAAASVVQHLAAAGLFAAVIHIMLFLPKHKK